MPLSWNEIRKRVASFEEPVKKLGDKQGYLTSSMHMAWVRYTCGRMKSDYRYSPGIVYNNFPWPKTPSGSPLSGGEQSSGSSPDKGRPGGVKVAAVESAAQAVLDARAQFMYPSLASGITSDLAALPPSRMASGSIRVVGGEGERVSAANSASLADLYDPLTMPPAPARRRGAAA